MIPDVVATTLGAPPIYNQGRAGFRRITARLEGGKHRRRMGLHSRVSAIVEDHTNRRAAMVAKEVVGSA